MHANCEEIFKRFAITVPAGTRVVECGSFDVNGSIRPYFAHCHYVGFDLEAGLGVDIVQKGPYEFPFEDEEVPVLVSANCAEHVEAIWKWVLEIDRVLRPGGTVAITAPWNIHLHRHPVHTWGIREDGWRYLFGEWMVENGREPYKIVECAEIGMDSYINAVKPLKLAQSWEF